jgi:CRISPR-associated endoribonuclease Cas6/Csy4 subtype I-F
MFSQEIVLNEPSTHMLSNVMKKLHGLFSQEVNCGKFAVSFPQHSFNNKKELQLGNTISVLCNEEKTLADLNLLQEFSEWALVTVKPNITSVDKYCLFKRAHLHSYKAHVTRKMKRGTLTNTIDLFQAQEKKMEEFSKHACLKMSSKSTRRYMKLYITKSEIVKNAKFNSYGLVTERISNG